MKCRRSPYYGHRFPREIISHAVSSVVFPLIEYPNNDVATHDPIFIAIVISF